jgi:hypothetical protein
MKSVSSRFAARAVALVVCGAGAGVTGADVVLDQQNVFVSAIGDTANAFSQEIGETFTVGVAGELAQVDVYLARFPFTTDNLVFRIWNTSGGLPSTQLGTDLSLTPAAVSTTAAEFESFDVSAFDVNVGVGEVLAFSITSTGSTSYILPYSETSLYAGGMPVRKVANVPPTPWEANPGVTRDYGFRTFVDVVPEPGAAAMLAVGGLAASLPTRLRRRRP